MRDGVLAFITRRLICIAVALTLVAVFIAQFRMPDIDELLFGTLSPVEELEVWGR